MKIDKYVFCLFTLICYFQSVAGQTYKTGDKLEAFIGNAWSDVIVVNAVTGKPGVYQVKTLLTGNKQDIRLLPLMVNKSNLRTVKPSQVTPPAVVATIPASKISLHLGRYELYSGIPTMYIGHIILLAEGKYKVAFSTDEDIYETGTYEFHAETNMIEWLTGMFKNNNWGGKFVTRSSGYRIEFNKGSFAEGN